MYRLTGVPIKSKNTGISLKHHVSFKHSAVDILIREQMNSETRAQATKTCPQAGIWYFANT